MWLRSVGRSVTWRESLTLRKRRHTPPVPFLARPRFDDVGQPVYAIVLDWKICWIPLALTQNNPKLVKAGSLSTRFLLFAGLDKGDRPPTTAVVGLPCCFNA